MTAPFDELLDATIQHLEELKARGEKFVSVTPEALASLDMAGRPARPTAAQSATTPASAVATLPSIRPAAGTTRPDPRISTSPLIPSATIGEPLPATSALTPEEKAATLAQLRAEAMACVKCPHLAGSRKNVVFGVGSANASLMFVGEAPGAEEDTQGEPFVGVAGQLLTRIIVAMGLTRESVYIANILKCRPDTPGQAYGNRKPTPEEMKTCILHLSRQVEIIRPSVIVALGATSVEGLLNLEMAGITRLRGNWREYRGIPVMPTFHPSFLLRPENASKKRLVWEDMLQVMERLALPISDKQRSFFMKSQ